MGNPVDRNYYTTLNDIATYSEVEGSTFFSLNEQNEIRLYDLHNVIKYLEQNNILDQFLIDAEIDDDILYDLDVDQTNLPMVQVLVDGTKENLNIENAYDKD